MAVKKFIVSHTVERSKGKMLELFRKVVRADTPEDAIEMVLPEGSGHWPVVAIDNVNAASCNPNERGLSECFFASLSP